MKELMCFKSHSVLNDKHIFLIIETTSVLPKTNLLVDEPHQDLPCSQMPTCSFISSRLILWSCCGMIYPMLCLELCFSTPVSTILLFYSPVCRFSMKFRVSVFTLEVTGNTVLT